MLKNAVLIISIRQVRKQLVYKQLIETLNNNTRIILLNEQ